MLNDLFICKFFISIKKYFYFFISVIELFFS